MSRDESPKRERVSFHEQIGDHRDCVLRCIDDDDFLKSTTFTEISTLANMHFHWRPETELHFCQLFWKVQDLKFAPAPEWPIDISVRLFVLMCGKLFKATTISRISHREISGARIGLCDGRDVEVNSFVFSIGDYRSVSPADGISWTEQAKHFIKEIMIWLFFPSNNMLRYEMATRF